MISFLSFHDATRVFNVHNELTGAFLDHFEPIFNTFRFTAPQPRYRMQIEIDEIQVRDLTFETYDAALAHLNGLTRDTAAPTNRVYENVNVRIVVEGLQDCFIAASRYWANYDDESDDDTDTMIQSCD